MKVGKVAKPIKSMARGGVSLAPGSVATEQSFTAALWAALVKEGAIVDVYDSAHGQIDPPPAPETQPKEETAVKPNSEANATAAAIKLADEHGLQLWSVSGTGADGRITLSDVKALVVED